LSRILLLAAALAACEPLARDFGPREDVPVRVEAGATPPPAPATLKVMAWNIKYGAARIDFWFDLWGDRVQMTREEVEANLAGIAGLVEEVQPDVLLLEEIEVGSRRSAYVDMVGWLLAHTRLAWAAYVPTWQSRYVPSEGLGRVDMGNAILAAHPIVRAERIALSDRTDQDALHELYYLHRAVGRAVLDLGGREVAILVVHTEAYDTDGTKSRQLVEIQGLLAGEPLPFVIGGDFNAIPPGSVKVNGFNDEHPDAIGTEFEQPPYRLEDLVPFYEDDVPAIPLGRYGTTEAEQRRYYTHSVIGPDTIGVNGEPGFWTRTLDYLFASPGTAWVDGSTDVLQEAGDAGIQADPLVLSDHAPVIGTWIVP
jgi:endonuclease/exonuclease/phosphatase family metal-dependent hydrolase